MKHKLIKCILKYCNSYTYGGAHGLCKSHYLQSSHSVKCGVTTWGALEDAGMAKSARR
jgi:hypothetical protein